MTAYIVRRLMQSIAFILIASGLVYTVLVYLIPGSTWPLYRQQVAQAQRLREIGGSTTLIRQVDEHVTDLEKRYKFDSPWPVSFFRWMFDPRDTVAFDENFSEVPKGIDVSLGPLRLRGSGFLTGDLGVSQQGSRSNKVTDLIGGRLPNTLLLVGTSLLVAVVFAVPVGVISAVRHRSAASHVLTFASIAGRSIPPFALGLVLMLFFAIIPYQLNKQSGLSWLPYLPPSEAYDDGMESNLGNRIWHLVLPAATLAIIQMVWIARFVRSAMLEVLNQDYIRTARAKGLTPWRVTYKHALRNALIPLITVVGLLLPAIISGATIVEQVFSYEGLGQLYYRALGGSLTTSGLSDTMPPPIGGPIDVPLALSLTVLLVIVVALANVVTDVLYSLADPRVDLTR
jgi:peptide/nickel transport system permease protein